MPHDPVLKDRRHFQGAMLTYPCECGCGKPAFANVGHIHYCRTEDGAQVFMTPDCRTVSRAAGWQFPSLDRAGAVQRGAALLWLLAWPRCKGAYAQRCSCLLLPTLPSCACPSLPLVCGSRDRRWSTPPCAHRPAPPPRPPCSWNAFRGQAEPGLPAFMLSLPIVLTRSACRPALLPPTRLRRRRGGWRATSRGCSPSPA